MQALVQAQLHALPAPDVGRASRVTAVDWSAVAAEIPGRSGKQCREVRSRTCVLSRLRAVVVKPLYWCNGMPLACAMCMGHAMPCNVHVLQQHGLYNSKGDLP